GAVNGVKGLVNNIQVAGAATPPSSSGSATSSTSPATPSIDATGTVASVDPSSGTITLSDGRVLRATDRTAVYQPTTVQALKPGHHVPVRGAPRCDRRQRRLDAVGTRSLTRGRERRYHPITQFADPPWLEYDTVTTPGRTTACRTTS